MPLAVSCTAVEAERSLAALTFPHERSHKPRRSLLALSCATLGEVGTGEVKLLRLPLSVRPVSDFILLQW